MKTVLTLVLLIGFTEFAFAQLDSKQQRAVVEGIAKTDRQEMWRGGYQNVSSQVARPTKSQIDEFIANNERHADPLDSDQIEAIYKCYHTSKDCKVYTINLYSEMYGGSGIARRWVMLNPNSGKYESFLHSVYEE